MIYEDLPVLSLIAGALEFRGHRVIVAQDACSFAAALDGTSFHLIILNFSKGPEVMAVLNRLKPPTKLIILSKEQKLPKEAYQVEVEDYIFLPCRAAEILRRIVAAVKKLEFRPLPTRTKNYLHPVRPRVYRQLSSLFKDMKISLLSMASIMQFLQQKAGCRNDQKLENLCQQAFESNQELLAIMRELEEPFI